MPKPSPVTRSLATFAMVAVAAVALGGCAKNIQTARYAMTATVDHGEPTFTNPTLNVVQSQKVVIDLTNDSAVTRGFRIDGYGIERTIDPGQHAAVSFRADKDGIFAITDPRVAGAATARLVVAKS